MANCVRSEVRVRTQALAAADIPKDCERAVEELMASMPDKGKWCVCLPLREVAQGLWSGSGMDGNGRAVQVRYEGRTGLVVD